MRAKKISWGEKTRTQLVDVLPLETPITIGYEASGRCNLKCSYCTQSSDNNTIPKVDLDLEAFKKSIDSLKQFPSAIKNVVFAVSGEPTLNKNLYAMVEYTANARVANDITIFTNAVALTPKVSKSLIESGLSILRVSIQALSTKGYEELCGVPVNFDSIVENIRFFYNYKKLKNSINGNECKVFVKIVDQSLREPGDKERFYNLFGDISDEIAIETIVPLRLEVEYSLQDDISYNKTMVGEEALASIQVCAQPFYAMYVRCDGTVNACCISDPQHLVIGNIMSDFDLYSIWIKGWDKTSKLGSIRYDILKNGISNCRVCDKCQYPYYGMHHCDRIDTIRDRLLKKF